MKKRIFLLSINSPRRFLIHLMFALAIISSALSVQTLSAQASTPVEYGYRDFTYPSGTGGDSAVTGEKPESKLWWNDGYWWGSLWSTSGNAYHIFRLDLSTQDWVDTGTAIDDRSKTKADTLWDGSYLYIVSHVFDANGGTSALTGQRGELYRYSYNTATKSYSLDTGFPVEVTLGKSETLVIAKDSTSQLWVTYVESGRVWVNHSLNGNDLVWGTPYILPVDTSAIVTTDDISSIITYNQHVGVMWSNQKTPSTMYFAVHPVNSPDSVWTRVRAYTISSDDHINLKSLDTDNAGNVFAVIKSSLSTNVIILLVCKNNLNRCQSESDWSAYPVYNDSIYSPTRPILLLDLTERKIYIFTRNLDSGKSGIYYKTSSMDNIQFPAGIGTPFIKSSTDPAINDPTSTKQNLSNITGLVVLASDSGKKSYLHNYLILGGGNPAPVITSFSPTSGPVGTQVTLTGSKFIGTTAVAFNGTAATFTFVSDTQLSTTLPTGATSGPISVTNAGGTGVSATNFLVIKPPSITSFTPTRGPVGTEVAVTGNSFTGASAVTFNSTPASSFTVDSENQLRATVPNGATTGPIRVTNPAGIGSSATNFTVTNPPIITSFIPTSGPVGTQVTLLGKNFTGTTSVLFNDTVGPYMKSGVYTVVSDTQLRANVQVSSTSGPISVSNLDGTSYSSTNFTVLGPPVITSFNPTSGPVGTEVTLTGSSFTGTTSVTFNGIPAVSFAVDSNTQLRATVPNGATSGPIAVTNPYGTASSSTDFTVTQPPDEITLEENRTGGATSSATVSTTASLTAAPGHLYLAAISTRPRVSVNSLSGLELTWTRLAAQCSGSYQTSIEVWVAQGSPSSNGPVTASLAGTPTNSVISVSRYSGVAAVNPVGNLVSGNTLGVNGACSGGVDSASYSFNLTTTVPGAFAFGAAAMRSMTHTPGAGYIERSEIIWGSGGNAASAALEDKLVASASILAVNGTFSSVVDWAVITLEIKP